MSIVAQRLFFRLAALFSSVNREMQMKMSVDAVCCTAVLSCLEGSTASTHFSTVILCRAPAQPRFAASDVCPLECGAIINYGARYRAGERLIEPSPHRRGTTGSSKKLIMPLLVWGLPSRSSWVTARRHSACIHGSYPEQNSLKFS